MKQDSNPALLDKTMTYGEFKADYLNLSVSHHGSTHQQIINMIWEDKLNSPRTIEHNKRDSNFYPMSPTDM